MGARRLIMDVFTKRRCLTHKTDLTPPLFIEVSVPNQESEQSFIDVLGVSSLLLSTIFCIGFLEMF
jgi:hypothetical protein